MRLLSRWQAPRTPFREPCYFYLAARYSRREELCGYREDLEKKGHIVVARWLDGNHQADELSTEDLNDGLIPHPLAARFGQEDLDDLAIAHVLVCFTEEPRSPLGTRGGRHVEAGVAMGLRMANPKDSPLIYIVGPRENVFYSTQHIDGVFDSWNDFLDEVDYWDA